MKEKKMKTNKIIIPKKMVEKIKIRILNALKVDETSGCWNLFKYIHSKKNGKSTYCKMNITNKGIRSHYFVHRIAYHIFKGEIPENILVLHKCHNYKCCNPDHLYLGDQKQNVKDCKIAGRENKATGERNNKTKLNEKEVKKIFVLKNMGYSNNQIARLHKVSPTCIRNILLHKTWKHLGETNGY